MSNENDILKEWKQCRFVQISQDLVVPGQGNYVVILSDTTFWSNHYDQLIEWCQSNGGQVNGMCVSFDHEHQLSMFTLRWS